MRFYRFIFLTLCAAAFVAVEPEGPDPRVRNLPVGYRIQRNGIWKYDGSSRVHRGIYDLEGSY